MGSWELLLSTQELDQLGVKVVLFPNLLVRVTIQPIRSAPRTLKEEGIVRYDPQTKVSGASISDFLGLPHVRELERKYPEE